MKSLTNLRRGLLSLGPLRRTQKIRSLSKFRRAGSARLQVSSKSAEASKSHANMFTPWPSMKAFLSQQHQQRNGSSSSKPAGNTNPTLAACSYLQENLKPDLTTQQRIATQLAACDIMLSSNFNAESGFSLVKDIKMTRPLTTKDGTAVPESYTRFSKVMATGKTTTHTLHLYSHPYGSLGIDDLGKYLADTVQDLGLDHGVFGIASLGTSISFFQFGASMSGPPSITPFSA